MKRVILLLSILTAGCGEIKEPHWEEVCVRSHTIIIMMPMYINGTPTMRPQPMIKCDEYELVCVLPYEGAGVCPPMDIEEYEKQSN